MGSGPPRGGPGLPLWIPAPVQRELHLPSLLGVSSPPEGLLVIDLCLLATWGVGCGARRQFHVPGPHVRSGGLETSWEETND